MGTSLHEVRTMHSLHKINSSHFTAEETDPQTS